MRRISLAATFAVLCSVACFHATIQTGATPGSTVIEQDFASAWIFGLIPPKTVETAAQCPNGVATVETQHSFLNQLVSFLTLDIYTPMTIKVTCAASRHADADRLQPDMSVSQAQGSESVRAAFTTAADEAVSQHRTVLVQVRQ